MPTQIWPRPGQTQFVRHLVAVADDLAMVQGTTTYATPPATYSNLWLVRLDDAGRCTEFTVWWMRIQQLSCWRGGRQQ